MTAKSGSKMKLWDFLIVFALVYLGSQLLFTFVFPKQDGLMPVAGIELAMEDSTITLGASPVAVITNHPVSEENVGTMARFKEYACKAGALFSGADCSAYAYSASGTTLTLANRCPKPIFDVYAVDANNTLRDITSDQIVIPCDEIAPIQPGEERSISLDAWKQSLFATPGIYEIELPSDDATVVPSASDESQYREGIITRFEIREPGFFIKIFRGLIIKPFLNLLILIASLLPGYNLGLAIILITLLVKLVLFIPTQHALEGQKKMQMLQPKLEALRKQYNNDAQKIHAETMKLWKEHNVNPMQSCLPLLVQFPVLIGLFYVLQDGVHLELSQHLVYPVYQNVDWSFGMHFAGFDLSESYPWIFPPILVVLQFIQMKLSFKIADKKKAKQIEAHTTKAIDTPTEVQQQLMLYALPFMIGFFALNYPSALSLYWGISTVFAIGQQLIVNREHIRP